MKKFCLAFFSIILCQVVFNQEYLKDINEISNHSDNVMKFLAKSELQEAFLLLKKYWPLPENEITHLETATIQQFNLVADRFGSLIGYEFIQELRIKDIMIRKVYVLKFEKHMLRVYITYYNNQSGWRLNGFVWDDQIDDLFELNK